MLARLAAGGEILGQLPHGRDRRQVGVAGIGHRALPGVRDRQDVQRSSASVQSQPPAPAAAPARRCRRSPPAGCGARGEPAKQRDGGRRLSSSARSNPPSGPTSRPRARRQARRRSGRRSRSIAATSGALGRPCIEHRVQGARRGDMRHGQPLACSAASVAIAAGAPRSPASALVRSVSTGSMAADAELGRLLHHPVGRVALQQGEPSQRTGLRRLRPELRVSTARAARSRRRCGDAGGPLAVRPLNSRTASPGRAASPCRGNAPAPAVAWTSAPWPAGASRTGGGGPAVCCRWHSSSHDRPYRHRRRAAGRPAPAAWRALCAAGAAGPADRRLAAVPARTLGHPAVARRAGASAVG